MPAGGCLVDSGEEAVGEVTVTGEGGWRQPGFGGLGEAWGARMDPEGQKRRRKAGLGGG